MRGEIRVPQSTSKSHELAVASLKSLLSDYTLRARQAEAMVNKLMMEKFTKEQLLEIVKSAVNDDTKVRGQERIVHQFEVLQATCFAVEAITQKLPDIEGNAVARAELIKVIEALTMTLQQGKT